MRPFHVTLAILVAAIWGCNFIFVKLSLNEIPPFFLCAIRFLLASIPAVFFIKKPPAPWRLLLLYGSFTFAIHFAFLFMGMYLGMPPGLTSLMMQTQLFFSLFLAMVFLNEQPTRLQILGGIVAFAGIGLVWAKLDATIPLSGFTLVIISAASWGAGNLLAKKMGRVNALGLVAWGCLIAFPPLMLLSFFLEGPEQIAFSLQHLSWTGVGSVFFVVYISTWVGYGLWNWLLSQYPMSMVVPFALLIPVFGMLGSVILFEEALQPWKMMAALLIIIGLSIHVLGPKLLARYRKNLLQKTIAI